jgi:hypothetical protein
MGGKEREKKIIRREDGGREWAEGMRKGERDWKERNRSVEA